MDVEQLTAPQWGGGGGSRVFRLGKSDCRSLAKVEVNEVDVPTSTRPSPFDVRVRAFTPCLCAAQVLGVCSILLSPAAPLGLLGFVLQEGFRSRFKGSGVFRLSAMFVPATWTCGRRGRGLN